MEENSETKYDAGEEQAAEEEKDTENDSKSDAGDDEETVAAEDNDKASDMDLEKKLPKKMQRVKINLMQMALESLW